MRDERPNTQVVRRRSTTAAVVSSQKSSLPPHEPFSLFTQCEQYGYEDTQTEA